MSQHFNEPIIKYSPGGDGSSNQTPTEEIRGAPHLEEIEEVAVELFPKGNTGENTRGNTRKKTNEKVAWSIKEHEALVSAYINGGGDVEKGTGRSKKDLWVTVRKLYEAAREANPIEINERTTKSLQNRWDHINGIVFKWVGVHAECNRNKKSGQTVEDVENDAHESYSRLYHGNRFILMHAWKIMRQKKKWKPPGMDFSCESGGSSKKSEPDTPSDEGGNSIPECIKKAKRKGKEAANSGVINFDSFQSSLEDINNKRNKVGERMVEIMKERNEEKKKRHQQEGRMHMLSMLMAKLVLDEDEKEMYFKLKAEFKNVYF